MLNALESKIHQYAVRCAHVGKRSDTQLCRALIRMERDRIYRKMGHRTLLDYIVKELGIDSTFTFQLKSVVVAAARFDSMAKALESGDLRVGHASRILSKVTQENVNEWVEFASTHTFAEVVERVATANPIKPTRETEKRLADNQTRISLVVNDETLARIKRARALLAQRNLPSKLADAMNEVFAEYIERRDPVRKAERAEARPSKPVAKAKPAQTRISDSAQKISIVHTRGRMPLTAAEKHAVFSRTGGRCAFNDRHGRCTQDRHVHIHHLKPVAEGGSNDPSNLTLLCSFHHDHVHQMSFPGMEMPYTLADHPEAQGPHWA